MNLWVARWEHNDEFGLLFVEAVNSIEAEGKLHHEAIRLSGNPKRPASILHNTIRQISADSFDVRGGLVWKVGGGPL